MTTKNEAKMTNVNYVTFKLPGREKNFYWYKHIIIQIVFKDYSEALPELLKVVVSVY